MVLETEKIIVDVDNCKKCKACVNECPMQIFFFENENLSLKEYTDAVCMECGHCVAVCSANVIKLRNISSDDIKEITSKMIIPSYEQLHNLFKIRRSVRRFKKDPIPDELWNKLIDVARIAPTGHNDQLVHFTIVRDSEVRSKIRDEMAKNTQFIITLMEDPSKKDQLEKLIPSDIRNLLESTLPALKTNLMANNKDEDFFTWGGELIIIHAPKHAISLTLDCTLAASYIILAAESLGLATCSLGVLISAINTSKSMARLIKFPRNHRVGYALAIGFPNSKYFRTPGREPAKITDIRS